MTLTGARASLCLSQEGVCAADTRIIKRLVFDFAFFRQLMSKARSPHRGMTKQQIIEQIRKTRQKLWEERLASYS